jgi:hypothetical protein
MGRLWVWGVGAVAACRPVDASLDPASAAPERCGADDLRWAPPPTTVDGLRAVPIDVQSLDASVQLDVPTASAYAEAALTFRVGPDGGMPFLDLRQTPAELLLDGEAVEPAQFAAHTFTERADSELRVLEVELAPCSVHTLVAAYPLGAPHAPAARDLEWDAAAGAVRWDFWFTDLLPGRYLESWFPANLVWDRFSFSLDLTLDAAAPHTLVTNAEVVGAEGDWSLEFPDTTTALSPLVLLTPTAGLAVTSWTEVFSDGTPLDLEVYRELNVPDSDPPLVERVVRAVGSNLESIGPLVNDRLVVYVWDEPGRSMEYDGATTTAAGSLEHELFHAWFGRGLRPASGGAGWLDEAWTTYNTAPAAAGALPADSDPVRLDAGDPFSRVTDRASYRDGRAFFGHLASLMGTGELRAAMADFYAQHAPDPVSTEQLETFLYCGSGDRRVAEAFWRYVRGQQGPRGSRPLPACAAPGGSPG